jgi:hypothetical protein
VKDFTWKKVKGSLDDIAIGPEGSIIGVRQRRGVWKFDTAQRKWFKIGKFALNVSVGPGGRPYVSTKRGTVFWPDEVCPSDPLVVEESETEEIGDLEEIVDQLGDQDVGDDESAFNEADFGDDDVNAGF